jgi:hypothetical protein
MVGLLGLLQMRPFVGLEVEERIPGTEGLKVSKLLAGFGDAPSPAEASGISTGDRIIKLGNTVLDNRQQFWRALDEYTVGDAVVLEVDHGVRVRRTVSVVLGGVGLTRQQVLQARSAASAADSVCWERPKLWKRFFQCSLRPPESDRIQFLEQQLQGQEELVSKLQCDIRRLEAEIVRLIPKFGNSPDLLASARLALIKKQQMLQEHLGGVVPEFTELELSRRGSVHVQPRGRSNPFLAGVSLERSTRGSDEFQQTKHLGHAFHQRDGQGPLR